MKILFVGRNAITAKYSVDNVKASDSNPKTITSQWANASGMTKCSDVCDSTTLNPDNSFVLLSGDKCRKALRVNGRGINGNPITFVAYRSGGARIIDGVDVISGRTNSCSDVWSSTLTTQPTGVQINNVVGQNQLSRAGFPADSDWFWRLGVTSF